MRAAGGTTGAGVHTWRRACVRACRSECVCVAAAALAQQCRPGRGRGLSQVRSFERAASSVRSASVRPRPRPFSLSPRILGNRIFLGMQQRGRGKAAAPSLSPSVGRGRSLRYSL